jgi:predicted TIM-barrel fold metal-dependent hydrolase
VQTRRDILIGAAGLIMAARSRLTAAARQAAEQAKTPAPLSFPVPAGACDSHTHVFGDPGRFPFMPARTYTPDPAGVDEMRGIHRLLRTDRVVVVQPSVYGTDNACLLDALEQLGPRARGIAVIGDDTPEEDLVRMERAGVRGIRVNLETAGQTDPAIARQRLEAATRRIAGRRWHVQVFTRPSVIAAIADVVAAATVPVVFDHFGGAQGTAGVQQTGFDALLALVRTGKAYVKLSAPYRGSTQPPDYPDMAPLARVLIAANPRRILWGTDWPHPNTSPSAARSDAGTWPRIPVDDVHVFNLFAAWAPDAGHRRTILVDNPAALYRF